MEPSRTDLSLDPGFEIKPIQSDNEAIKKRKSVSKFTTTKPKKNMYGYSYQYSPTKRNHSYFVDLATYNVSDSKIVMFL